MRAAEPAEAAALARLYATLTDPDAATLLLPPAAFARRLQADHPGGVRYWLAYRDRRPVGYASVSPAPGLPGVYDLDGGVLPDHRRQGGGSRLLMAIVGALRAQGARRQSHPTPSLDTQAARFLLSHDFVVGHREMQLQRADLEALSVPALPPSIRLQTFARPVAADHFRHLYEAAFRDSPWYQPYHSAAEVETELDRATDLLFLTAGSRVVGFAWLRGPLDGVGEIEPIGLIPRWRGQGLGRVLLLAALDRQRRRGAARAQVALWRDNERALALYRSLDFRPVGQRYFLERVLHSG